MKYPRIKIVTIPGLPKDQVLMISDVDSHSNGDNLVIPKNNVVLIKNIKAAEKKENDND